MKRFLIFLTLFLSFSVFSHGPSPQKVQKEITINASPEKVWAVVKDFEHANTWLPFVKEIKVDTKGEDKFRTLVLNKGGKILEKLKGIDNESMKIKYEIVEGDIPVADFNAYITVTKGASANESKVQWTGRFYRVYKLNPPIPEGQDDESAVKAITEAFDAGLPALKKLLESK
jgi:mxaD protein